MQLIIHNKYLYAKSFIYKYLPKYIYNLAISSCDKKILDKFDKEFDINSLEVIKKSMGNLIVSEQWDSYIIKTDKNLKYDRFNLDSVINLITYGNRTCKGYKLIFDIFELVGKKIDIIYKEWQDRWL